MKIKESTHRCLMDHHPLPFAYHRIITGEGGEPVDGVYLDVNQAFCAMTGRARELTIGQRVSRVLGWIDEYATVATGGAPVDLVRCFGVIATRYHVYIYGAEPGHFACVFAPAGEAPSPWEGLRAHHQTLQGLVGVRGDITEKGRIEAALKESEARIHLMAEIAPVGILLSDKEHQIIYVNRKFSDMFGYTHHDIPSMDAWWNRTHPDKTLRAKVLAQWNTGLGTLAATGEGDPVELPVTCKDGAVLQVEFRLAQRDDFHVIVATDVTERRKAEERIRYMSFHDSITGLYNRAFLDEEMKRLDAGRQLPISIIMTDLNGLKLVNDTYGHSTGDQMLKSAAVVLQEACREEDLIARWGGDEFVVLLPRTQLEEAWSIGERILEGCQRVTVADVPLSMALGVAAKEDGIEDLERTLQRAEDSMYRDKLTERRSTRHAVVEALLKTLQAKSSETESHTRGMQDIARRLGERVGLSHGELMRLDLLITLHDIGKISLPEEVLLKREPLTELEWSMMEKHPEIGYRIAHSTEGFAHVAEDILSHHERWDGEGYPRGLAGAQIPLLARVASIADAYEVMISGRPYRQPLTRQEVEMEFVQCSGLQFDPDLTLIFLSLLREEEIADGQERDEHLA